MSIVKDFGFKHQNYGGGRRLFFQAEMSRYYHRFTKSEIPGG